MTTAKRTRKPAIYRHDYGYAQEHNQLKAYTASAQANEACRIAIESAIAEHHQDSRLSKAAVEQVVDQYGYDRLFYILAITIQAKESDGRISARNKAWAQTIPVVDEPGNYKYIIERTHIAIVNLFLDQARKMADTQNYTPHSLKG